MLAKPTNLCKSSKHKVPEQRESLRRIRLCLSGALSNEPCNKTNKLLDTIIYSFSKQVLVRQSITVKNVWTVAQTRNANRELEPVNAIPDINGIILQR